MNPKRALVVSGGGSKGAFAVGAIEVLLGHGLTFDVATGTSTGALIAPLVATGDIALLRHIYSSVHTRDILTPKSALNVLVEGSVYDTAPLWRLIHRYLTPERYEKLLRASTDVFVCAVNLQSGQSEFFSPRGQFRGTAMSHDIFCRAILASSSQPVLMPAVHIPSLHGDQYVDGGVREVAPLRKAIQENATEIYAVVLGPEQPERNERRYDSVVDTLLRALDLMLEEVICGDVDDARFFNDAVAYVERVRQRVAQLVPAGTDLDAVFETNQPQNPLFGRRKLEVRVIRPESSLPTAGLEFDPIMMSEMMAMGREAATKALL